MSKYFLDTEFLEGSQKIKSRNGLDLFTAIWLFLIVIAIFIFDEKINTSIVALGLASAFVNLYWYFFNQTTTNNTIDLISIGIVSEDDREYYAVSKDFNLKEAWNRFQMKETSTAKKYMGFYEEKEYWIRENVLKPIYYEWCGKDIDFHEINHFTYSNFKKLLNKYGKTNKQIARDIVQFVYPNAIYNHPDCEIKHLCVTGKTPEFYAYYADYDWVVFCWLFGGMIDLPKGFPMYCRDLKQMLDEFCDSINYVAQQNSPDCPLVTHTSMKNNNPRYPKETNEHHALADAKWGYQLYKFIKSL